MRKLQVSFLLIRALDSGAASSRQGKKKIGRFRKKKENKEKKGKKEEEGRRR